MAQQLIVFVTCSNPRQAARIARAVVKARLAACANILPGRVRSIYRWKGKVETTGETMMMLKTSRRRFDALCHEIERLHSYDTPEIIALPVTLGARKYLAWIEDSLRT